MQAHFNLLIHMSALLLLPPANVPACRTRRTNAGQDGDAAFCQITLGTCYFEHRGTCKIVNVVYVGLCKAVVSWDWCVEMIE